ncbi:hypothetical protein ADIAL_1850 [Alkalibacterium sp. AK22]|uniref:DUF1659 domain-containing protein n=1 Tax=Alkalibacterium sp. AK22 TaxID=1229520 RepID=UPI000447DC6E|nr:hypothetical protein [Alkalibacterium sp. AK22]EXJ22735.1 hypothetical protein ADIAL_1850 [Alkalibacterium sp. AK22]
MKKEWSGSKVDVLLEDLEGEKLVRRSFRGAHESLTDVQVTEFTQALESVSDFPVSHALVIDEYRYTY